MNAFMYEMLGRQRYEEMVRAAEETRRVPSAPSWRPVGDLLIRFGRGLERAGERLTASSPERQVVGGVR